MKPESYFMLRTAGIKRSENLMLTAQVSTTSFPKETRNLLLLDLKLENCILNLCGLKMIPFKGSIQIKISWIIYTSSLNRI